MCTSDHALQVALDEAFDEGFDFCLDMLRDKLRKHNVLGPDDLLQMAFDLPNALGEFLRENPEEDKQ